MVNNRTSLDPRWTRHHVASASGFMLATIEITRRVPNAIETVQYDMALGKYSGAGTTTIFQGPARIQPYGIIGDQIVGQDPTGRRLMRVQVKDKTPGVKLDDHIHVLECEDNPELTNFLLEVRGSIGSSNAWVTDLVCEANLKWTQGG